MDLTRLNRSERRRIGRKAKMKIAGRNLPYVKAIHKSWDNYMKLREAEIAQDQKARDENSHI